MRSRVVSTLFAATVCLAITTLWAPSAAAEKKGKPVRYDEKKMDEPVLVHKVTPKYPKEAKDEKVQGTVVLEATIGRDGLVAETRLVKDPDPRLSKAARHAVGQWRYKPVLDADGQPLEVLFTVTLRFALK